MQSKTITRYLYMPVVMAKEKILPIPSTGDHSEQLEPTYVAGGNGNGAIILKNGLVVSHNSNPILGH